MLVQVFKMLNFMHNIPAYVHERLVALYCKEWNHWIEATLNKAQPMNKDQITTTQACCFFYLSKTH